MSRRIDRVERVRRLLDEAALLATELTFDEETNKKITDEIWSLANRLMKMQEEQRIELLQEQERKKYKSFDKPPVAEVISVTDHTVIIRCPYCGYKHIHGRIPGHVVAHCREKHDGNVGYVIPDV